MGQFFSRALRRFTQGSNASSNQHQLEKEKADETVSRLQQQREREHVPIVQSIPVGQSIDSSDYVAFEASKQQSLSKKKSQEECNENINDELEKTQSSEANNEQTAPGDDSPTKSNNENTPQVEEAVIKIQAYVRGHLTRKALKDAQHQNTPPSPLALGQSQFDEESLTRNHNQPSGRLTPKLESIAEETQNSISLDKRDVSLIGEQEKVDLSRLIEGQPQALNLSVNLTTDSRSASPVPSEANASIDLNCGTPASASIDIADHNIKPTDKMASVLYHKVTPTMTTTDGTGAEQMHPPQVVETMSDVAPPRNDTPPLSSNIINDATLNNRNNLNSHSIDSAEAAAAIRIQSAFRGYHTRKHSPYRRRSPTSTPPQSLDSNQQASNGTAGHTSRGALRQQDATVVDDDEDDEGVSGLTHSRDEDETDRLGGINEGGRRQSRQRQRDITPEAKSSESIEDTSALSDQPTIKEKATSHAIDTDSVPNEEISNDDGTGKRNNDCPHELAETQDGLTNALSEATENLTLSMSQDGAAVVGVQHDSSIQQLPRLSLGTKSAASIEIDTDSSALGAALSINEDPEENLRGDTQDISDRIIDDHSFGENLVASLVDDPSTSEAIMSAENSALDAATEALEAALDDAIDEDVVENEAGIETKIPLNEDDQRAIELNSDDIEKRDPRGHATDTRTRSPQIEASQSQPPLVEIIESVSTQQGPSVTLDDATQMSTTEDQTRLGLDSPDEAFASGTPSPAVPSSHGSSSDDGLESDAERGDISPDKSHSGEHKQGPSNSGGNRNKKKSRNKKRGKK